MESGQSRPTAIRLEPEQTKTSEARLLPLPSVLVDMLAEVEPKEGRVFDGTNLRKEWMTACHSCELGRKIEVEGKPYDPRYEGLTLHDLRRSAVRNLINAGVRERVAMQIQGEAATLLKGKTIDGDMTASKTRKPVRGESHHQKVCKSLMALSSRG